MFWNPVNTSLHSVLPIILPSSGFSACTPTEEACIITNTYSSYTTGCWYMWSCGLYSNPSREPCTIIRHSFPNKTGMLSTTAAHPLTVIFIIRYVFWGGHVRVAWKALQIFFILLQCDVHTVLQYLAAASAMLIHKSQEYLVQSASFRQASTLKLRGRKVF